MNIIYYGCTDGLVMTQDNYQYIKEHVFYCWPGTALICNNTVALWRIKQRKPEQLPDWTNIDYPNNINA